ncbi:LysR substrate-binding domain-containing protein [Halomonas sp. EGI 63088]|uniref:LysR substrate-binding domain-containing protein n=1 Tax=Halomonas flagellata TaxID=2920385 RepID=A0ABS9RQL4_9GAMM|nr:LysR substrate-binding domain-containing protein [Halomonas flagellata]MCH4562132.1 LysR substrate-binding domain-containing protein [Halomonas flagellata]
MSWIARAASPNSLRVFEAAARHLSFTAAARELRSTQSAVSQQIRTLEENLGLPLFERIYRGVKLTEAGQALFASVQEGFATIDRTIDRLQHRHRHPHVNILTDFSFAAYWLMPRLPRFREQHPHIDVRIVTNQGVLDWRTQEVDIAILFCDERTLAGGVPQLFREEVLPVCSPGFLQQHGPIENLETLSEAPLLTLTAEQGQSWLDWPSYFEQRAGISYLESSELTFNNYTLLIQAAIAGQGIGMGWLGLVDDMLESGMLVGLHELGLRSSRGYGLIDARPDSPGEAKRALQEWVLACAEPSSRE